MPEKQDSPRGYSRHRRTSTWEFLPDLEISPQNVYKFNETVMKDRHLFKQKGKLANKKCDTVSQSEEVELPVLNRIHLSLDIGNCCHGDEGCTDCKSGCDGENCSPIPSARFNEPLNAYVSSRKKTNNHATAGYMEAFPRSLPSVDQTTMARKLVIKRRFEQQNNLLLGRNLNDVGFLPLLRFSQGNPKAMMLQSSPSPRPRRHLRQVRESVKNIPQEQTLHIWDPTMMDTLMKRGKVLVPR